MNVEWHISKSSKNVLHSSTPAHPFWTMSLITRHNTFASPTRFNYHNYYDCIMMMMIVAILSIMTVMIIMTITQSRTEPSVYHLACGRTCFRPCIPILPYSSHCWRRNPQNSYSNSNSNSNIEMMMTVCLEQRIAADASSSVVDGEVSGTHPTSVQG